MTPRERFLAALGRERVRPIPVGAVTQSATLEQMETLGTSWPEAHADGAAMARLADGARTILGFDMVRVPFDQTIEAELLGAEVSLGDRSSNCSVRSHPCSFASHVPAVPDFGSGRAAEVAKAIAILKRTADGSAAVLGGIVGPFTLVCELAGLAETLTAAVQTREVLRRWVEFAVNCGIEYACRQVEAGADAIVIEDMCASMDCTSPMMYFDVVLPAQQRLIDSIGAPVILHICGSNTRILDVMAQSGAAALSLEATTDLAKAVLMDAGAVAGGIEPVRVLLKGTADTVRAACRESLAAGVHILSPGCGIPPTTPVANLKEMVRAAREWDR